MAFRHGKYAEITVNAVALSAFCDSADLSIDVDTAEASTFGQDWKRQLAGLAGATLDLTGDYDPTETTGPADVLQALIGVDDVPIVLYPGGNVAGQAERSFDAVLKSYKESAKIADVVKFSASFVVTGAVTFDTV